MATSKDYIYLDGTNTENDPYTCQSETTPHPGIYINKSLSLVGIGPKPPHMRCSDGLTFDGSDYAQQMHITLSGLFLNKSLVYFQDCTVNIDRCKFEGSKRGVFFLVSTRIVSIIQITDSAFVNNSECISVVVNKRVNLSEAVQVVLTVKHSSFHGNVIIDEGSCVSFHEASDNKHSVSLNITLENVTLYHNKFSTKGLVFLDMENANQDIHFQNVTFMSNNALSRRNVSAAYGYSECIVHSSTVNIVVNASSFTSQHARSFNVIARNISLQINISSFRGHIVEGNGGAIRLRGSDHCVLKVSESSFTNALGSLEGGAVHITALTASVQLHHTTFTNCTSLGQGGGVFIHAMSRERSVVNAFHLVVDNSRFVGCRSNGFDNGGSLSVLYENRVKMSISGSHFISNYAANGGAISLFPFRIDDKHWRSEPSQVTIKNSSFFDNSASYGGAIYLVVNNQSILILENVIMEANRAQASGGAAAISQIFAFKILNSRLLKNNADEFGGAFTVSDVNTLEIKDSLFDGNIAGNFVVVGPLEFGGALYISCGLITTLIVITNTTFNNCSAEQDGGAIYLAHLGNVSLVIRRSRFVENLSLQTSGGALSIQLPQDNDKNPGCYPENVKSFSHRNDDDHDEEFASLVSKNHLSFEDITFERNAGAVGGAVYLSNGKATFVNCSFTDNFALSQGGHIYTVEGSASLEMQGSLFQQTMRTLQLLTMNYSKASFFHVESSGPFKVYNTTMNVRAYGVKNPVMLVANGRVIDLGDDSLTKFYCPVGSRMEFLRFTQNVKTQVNNTPCNFEITSLELSCSPCDGNTYSLERGHALGSKLAEGFQCLPCPFGANCTQNILAKRNFWGYKDQKNPLLLHFTMCPEGYCSPPQEANFPEYNGCQGNRSGNLCGHCHEGYTETLYSTNCRPSHQCRDYWFWPVALFYVSLMALYFVFTPPIIPWIKRQILWFKENKPVNQDYNFDKGYLKILFYFYQAANLVIVSSSSQHVIKTNLIDPIVGFFNFKSYSVGFVCPFSGLTVVSKQFFSASYVFCTMLMVCFCYVLHCGIQRLRGQGAPFVGSYVGAILQTLLLGYTTLATVSFSLLRCVPIGSEKRLFYDGNHVCFQWWQNILVGFACTFVIPFVFVLLWGSYKLYGKTLSTGKFLLACFFPLPSLIHWLFVSFGRVQRNPVNDVSTPHQMSMNSVERVLYDSFKRPDEGGKLSLGWEGIMIGRRLILVVLKSFVNSPMPRLLIMSLFCFLFLLHHVVTQPFRDSLANTAETISLLSIAILGMVNLFFASFLSLAVSFNDYFSSWWKVCEGVEVVILCLVPAVFGLLVVIAILSQLCRLAVVVCRLLYNFCCICFRCRYINQSDEPKPLLAPVR